ncbi:hypothetical protein Tco_0321981 [Tanacetum coccineum]
MAEKGLIEAKYSKQRELSQRQNIIGCTKSLYPNKGGSLLKVNHQFKEILYLMRFLKIQFDHMENRECSVVGEDKRIEPIVSTDGSKVSTDRQIKGTDEQNEGTEEHNEGTEEHNEGTEEHIEGTEEQIESTDGQRKGTEDHTEEGSTRKEEKIEEEDESESESDGIPKAEKKFKQLESDEEMARKIQEEWEGEEERNRIAEEKATNEALIRNFDDIKARIEADRPSCEKLQEQERSNFTIKERAKFLHDTITAQRKFLAQQR